MNIWMKITSCLVVALLATFTVTTAIQSTASAQDCAACGSDSEDCHGSCRGRLLHRRAARATCCPSCDAEICELKTKEVKEKKTCYKVEEKTICVPAVRLPWQKCAPTTSKTRKINVLKKHSFECPKCEYSWSVVEPTVVETEAEGTTVHELENRWNGYTRSPSIAPPPSGPRYLNSSSRKLRGFTPSRYFDSIDN